MSAISSGSSRAIRSVGSSRISSSEARSISWTSQALASSSRERSRRASGPRMGASSGPAPRSYPRGHGERRRLAAGSSREKDCVRVSRPDLDRRGPPSACWRPSRRLGTRTCPLERRCGRVLAEDVTSAIDVPPFDSSAMDGYALVAGPSAELEVIGESRAGTRPAEAVRAGAAVRISTGAAVPEGARCRDARSSEPTTGATATESRSGCPTRAAGANIRRAGEDIRAGRRGAAGPALCSAPAELGVAASVGRAGLRCARRPRVAVLVTGDELTAPGRAARAGRDLLLERLRAQRPGRARGRASSSAARDRPRHAGAARARRSAAPSRRPTSWSSRAACRWARTTT